MNKLTSRVWASFIVLGLVGQFAWTIENMYFNVFLYNTISTEPGYIAAMVAASAIVATLTTLVMGALSDKVGKRKLFISGGYILWGFSTLAFGFINKENAAAWFPAANAVTTAAALVVVLDCIMTFFGSTANDAAFNAFVTDVTCDENRGRAESVLSTLPLISMLIIFGAFDSMTQQGLWKQFFMIFGILVTLTGVGSIFLLKDGKIEKKEEAYFSKIIYGFRPSVIKANKPIYLALCALGMFSVAVQVFFPYLIIYMQNYLKIDAYAIVLGIVLIIASIVSVVGGRFIDRVGKLRFVLPAACVMFAGLLGMYFVRSMVAVIVAGAVMMSGYMLVVATLSATVRDFTPRDKVGHFQGIRMIFAVLLPMVIGPSIGAAVIRGSADTYVELGVVRNVPTPGIFLAAAAVLILVALPVALLKRRMADIKGLPEKA
ncbi:MAG: MFS transporter [Clostridiales bacterium]|nr:MFS transporter [Clostridiales bacterium]